MADMSNEAYATTFKRFVEIGRVAYCIHGKDNGKLVVIVDVIDQNRALVDGPRSGVARKAMNFKHLHLTGLKMHTPRSARTGVVGKLWDKNEMTKKWEETTWAKKIAAKQRRSVMTDFDRFKLMKAQQARRRLINLEFGKLKKAVKAEKKANPKPKRMRKTKK